ncbi:MAG: protein-disulfide reductase DsbD [Gammaproteobacteria bacterium]|nr:protein-disulfide reductase DsbD [Gammaproteobacteria bacterium]
MSLFIRFLMRVLLIAASFAAFAADNSSDRYADTFSEDVLQSVNALEEPEFLPVDKAFVLTVELTDASAVLARWTMPDGYYLYRHRFKFESKNGAVLGDARIPDGKRKVDEYFGEVEVYYHGLDIEIPVLAQSGRVLEVGIEYQGCADYGLCYPPETRWVSFDVGATGVSGPSTPSGGSTGTTFDVVAWLAVLGSAVLGGLILNLMPCVFPILSIKALSLIDVEHESQRLRHALGYTLGVIATFVVLGGILAILRGAGEAVGWGFQLQSPAFVASLALLFFVLGLNLLGILEVPGFGVAMDKPNPFATGILAVVVATPCTVPFMGVALGYGLSQSTGVLLSVMVALGVGMALPYVALTGVPQLARRLPRPGPWMVTLKQVMAFPLFATVVWLVWVLVMQVGANGVAIVLSACVVLAFLAWLGYGNAGRLRWVWTFGLITAGLVVWSVPRVDLPAQSGTFDIAVIEAHRARGEPVFLNLTAAWCITCLANDRSTLSSDRVKGFFADRGIRYIKGDWTNADPAITAVLESFGRSGVPLYVYFPPDGDPVVLPQLLTPGIVIDTISGATGQASTHIAAK